MTKAPPDGANLRWSARQKAIAQKSLRVCASGRNWKWSSRRKRRIVPRRLSRSRACGVENYLPAAPPELDRPYYYRLGPPLGLCISSAGPRPQESLRGLRGATTSRLRPSLREGVLVLEWTGAGNAKAMCQVVSSHPSKPRRWTPLQWCCKGWASPGIERSAIRDEQSNQIVKACAVPT